MKKCISVLLALVLLLGVCVMPARAEEPADPMTPPTPCQGADVWDGTAVKPTRTAQRDGVTYFEISTCEELAYIAQEGNEDWLSYNYILTNDLILNDVKITWDEDRNCTNPDGQLKQWTPIGNRYSNVNGFSGKFDGQGHIISGLYINGNKSYCGLFGYCGYASIGNIILVNSYVKGREETGSISGHIDYRAHISKCINYGSVLGSSRVGGMIGYARYSSISGCVTYGPVSSSGSFVGGVAGYLDDTSVYDCANLAAITGGTKTGGIAGENVNAALTHCYNIGTVTATDPDGLAGGISGASDHWMGDKSTITNCYYGKDVGLNQDIYAFGNYDLANDKENVAEPKTLAQLKQQGTFVNWDFTNDWSINESKNGGYPYPAWIDPGDAVPVTGVSLVQSALSLAVGDVVYLTPSISPTNAGNTACTWASSDAAVVSVAHNGRAEAKKAGSATLTVTTADGGFTATCSVTVVGRSGSDFRLGTLTLRDLAGNKLSAIPAGGFLVSVPVTKLAEYGDVNVLLAVYDDAGRFLQLLHADVTGLYQNQTITLSLYVPNSGKAAKVKVFAISSLSDLTPLSPAVQFPAAP